MHDSEFESYLDLLARFLRLSPRQRAEIRRELRAHLDDALAEAADRGEPPDAALRRVLSDFGDAAELAARFRTSHKKQRWIMHATLSAACLAFALVTFSFFSPPAAQQANAARTGGSDVAPSRTSEPAADAQIRAALNKTIPEVSFQDMQLGDALRWLQDFMNVNLHVQWSALDSAGVARDTQLSFTLKNITVERLLRMIIDELEPQVAYAVQDGVLMISTRERLRRNLRTQVYDVRDLLEVMQKGPSSVRAGESAAAMLALTRSRLGREEKPTPSPAADPSAAQDHAQAGRLAELITNMVDPDTWQPNGGSASIEEFNGVLVVRQFDAVHSQVRELLDALRAALVEKR